MAKHERKTKVGFVTLACKGTSWHVRFKDPIGNGDIRRKLPVATEAEAMAMALEYNRALLGSRGMVPSMREPSPEETGPTVRKALLEAISASGGQATHKARQMKGANAFLAWLAAKHPAATHWAMIKPSMVAAWVRELGAEGRAFDTVRLYLAPVRAASKFWATERPETFRDVAALARIRLQRTEPKPVVVLAPGQLGAFLETLRGVHKPLWVLATIAATCGLRELEAAALRHCDVDWQAGTLTVTDTGTHKPKNAASRRTIPAHPAALAAIREYMAGLTVRDANPQSPLLLSGAGKPWTLSAQLQAWRRVKKAHVDLPGNFKTRHLRALFATYARRGGADARLVQVFIGHSRGDVLGAHYERIAVADLRCVLDAFDHVRCEKSRQQTGIDENGGSVSQVVSV